MHKPVDIPSLCIYLTFAGNCKEAMTFYQQCLGGTLSFATLDESPVAENLSAAEGKYVLLAQLRHSMLTILATDIVPDEGLIQGNNVSVYLTCNNVQQLQQLYAALSEGGIQTQPVHQTFFGEWFGNLTDRFGMPWLLYHSPSPQQ
ncbi:MAG: VOC family protein [Bacteroidota bacterium]